MELIKASKNAFVLLYVIAQRAQRTDRINQHNLKPGEAFLGDHESYGMSEGEYRNAKKVLKRFRLATFRRTNRGTIATLIDTSIFDINVEVGDGQESDQNSDQATTNERAPDAQTTTTNNEKKENLDKKVNPRPFEVPKFEPLPKPLFRNTGKEMISFMEEQIEKVKTHPDAWHRELDPKIADLILLLEKSPRPNSKQDIEGHRQNPDNYRRVLKDDARSVIKAFKVQIEKITAAMNGVEPTT